MSENLPYDEINFNKNVKLQVIIYTPEDSDIGFFLEVDSKNPAIIKEKTKKFPFTAQLKKLFLIILHHIWRKTYQKHIYYKKN